MHIARLPTNYKHIASLWQGEGWGSDYGIMIMRQRFSWQPGIPPAGTKNCSIHWMVRTGSMMNSSCPKILKPKKFQEIIETKTFVYTGFWRHLLSMTIEDKLIGLLYVTFLINRASQQSLSKLHRFTIMICNKLMSRLIKQICLL